MSAPLQAAALAERLGLSFHDLSLLERALTHPTWAVENGGPDYERLEFLGDSVVGLAVSGHLYEAYPDVPEGELTKMRISLVRGDVMAQVAGELGLHEAVRLGKGAEGSGDRRRASIREALFEAVIGAVYLDAGFEAAAAFVLRSFGARLESDALGRVIDDPKSLLQAAVQRQGLASPTYRVSRTTGPAHEPTFHAEVLVGGEVAAAGTGRSKQAAERDAAAHALAASDGEDAAAR